MSQLGPPSRWIEAARVWRAHGKALRPTTTVLDFVHDFAYWARMAGPPDLTGGWE